MSVQPMPAEPRISLAAVKELDRLAREFRRKLRDVAVELSVVAGHSTPIGRETVLEAVPLACRDLLLRPSPRFGDERGSDGPKEAAA